MSEETFGFGIVLLCVMVYGFIAVMVDIAVKKWRDNITGRSLRAAALGLMHFITHYVPKWAPFFAIPLAIWFFSSVALLAYQTGLIAHVPQSPWASLLIGSGISAAICFAGAAYGTENTGRPWNRRALERYKLPVWPICFFSLAQLAGHPGVADPKPVLSGYLFGLATAAAAIGLFIYVQSLVRTAADDGRQTDDGTSAKDD